MPQVMIDMLTAAEAAMHKTACNLFLLIFIGSFR